VIVNPEFDSSNATDWLQFSRIELSDTATIVWADVYNHPNNWIQFTSGSTLRDSHGKIYKLIGCNGLELDKQVYMPKSGNVAFTAFFEPIDKNEKTIDYYESGNENDWRIYGIKLYDVKHTEPIHCTLKGEVQDHPQSSRLMLLKVGADNRTANREYILIHDGKFEYVLHTDAEQAYELIFCDEQFDATWRPIEFIAEQGVVNFVLQSMDKSENNLIQGGKLNNEYQPINKDIVSVISKLYDSLNIKRKDMEEVGQFYTAEAMQLHKQMESLKMDDPIQDQLMEQYMNLSKEGRFLTPEGQAQQNECIKVNTMYIDKGVQYAKEHPGIAGYTILVKNIGIALQTKDDVSPMFEIYNNIYKAKYPNHPYATLIESYINASSVKVGNSSVDVSALDSDGKMVRLSELIKGKITLIHLWASWCGPCRKHGIEMIPVYEKYKDKGFTVVGIARERNKSAMLTAINRDKYPWTNLLELKDEQGIWAKFGIGNAGGGDFLVDEKGVFLSVNATPDEVKKILEAKYD
jgi:thiol-disulfide isomerase/thioredoxin